MTNQTPDVVLGGASAGAALAAATTLRNRDRALPLPTALVLAYGTFHASLPPITPELRKRIRGIHGITQFRPSTVDTMNLNYAGSRAVLRDPHAFPGAGDVTGASDVTAAAADHAATAADYAATARAGRTTRRSCGTAQPDGTHDDDPRAACADFRDGAGR